MTPNDPNNPNHPNAPEQPSQPTQSPPGYPQPSYGQPGHPAYQQPSYPGAPYLGAPFPGMQPPPRRGGGLMAAVIAGVVVVCVVCVAGVYVIGNVVQGAASSVLATLAPTETAQALQLTPSPSETIGYQDTLTDTPTGWVNDAQCQFKPDGYHVSGGAVCLSPSGVTPDDADVSVTVKGGSVGDSSEIPGYGVVFRHVSQGNFYSFEITSVGIWALVKFVNGNGTIIAPPMPNHGIPIGAGGVNTLRVVMSGAHFTFFVNHQQVGAANDATYATGDSGVFNDDPDPTTEATFTNFSIAQPMQ